MVAFQQIGGGAPFKERHLHTLGLLSLSDVVSSSVEHYVTKSTKSDYPEFLVKAGAHHVLQWLAQMGLVSRNDLYHPHRR